jgi:hypothetical protein
MNGVSDSVLDALARALQLDEAERAHLFDLARAAHPTTPARRRRPTKQRIRPSVQWILDAMTGAAAFVRHELVQGPGVDPDLPPLVILPVSDEQRGAAWVEVVLGQRKRFLDAKTGAPEHDDQRTQSSA